MSGDAQVLEPSSAFPESAHADRLAAARRSRTLDAFSSALDASNALKIPEPVSEVVVRIGQRPKLPAEAFELARQIYYLRHGSLRDAARAVIDAGLSETSSVDAVTDRLRNWWLREDWPKRAAAATFAIRDANHDGGLYRSERVCQGLTTGNGAGPAGEPCGQSALVDSDFCAGHDPRPEYVEARSRSAARLLASRRADMVPIEPFAKWCDATRRQMLIDARLRGERLHQNSTGWALLSAAMKVDQSALHRLVTARTSSRGREVTEVRASTVVKYLESIDGVTFEDIYGFAPPARTREGDVCPSCGNKKQPMSKTCYTCHSTRGSRCNYVNRRGERCKVSTEHESGYCCSCRQIVFRVHKPRTGRTSFVSVPMLILATEAYVATPKIAAVARRMWSTNACGVCDVFANATSLTGSLVKQFSKRGWTDVDLVAAAHRDLVREHGDVAWPNTDQVPLEAAAVLPAGPFVEWLREQYAILGSYSKLAKRIGMNPDNVSRRIRGLDDSMIFRSSIDRALAQWGDETEFRDIYGGRG